MKPSEETPAFLRFGANRQGQGALFPSALAIWGADAVMVEKLDAAFPDAWKTGELRGLKVETRPRNSFQSNLVGRPPSGGVTLLHEFRGIWVNAES
jgi:hypothetical protein